MAMLNNQRVYIYIYMTYSINLKCFFLEGQLLEETRKTTIDLPWLSRLDCTDD